MRKIIIAIDSFKGCLTSAEANAAATEAIHYLSPQILVESFPIADGGEGVLEVLLKATGGKKVTVSAHDPLMRPLTTEYGIAEHGTLALIELASASGLPLLKPHERNVMMTTTYGTGEMIADALNKGCSRFVIGIGGSATNDAGMGALQALGFRFLDAENKVMPSPIRGCDLQLIQGLDCTQIHPKLKAAKFVVACDVKNPLYGPLGAAYVFAPQKGATEAHVQKLDQGLQNIARILDSHTGRKINEIPGSGAAGGTGGGFHALLDAELKSGIDLLLDMLHFESALPNSDLIITGEGSADRQTAMGKVATGILNVAKRHSIPVALIAGQIKDETELTKAGYHHTRCINPPGISLEEAMRPETAKANIRNCVTRLVTELST